MGAPYCLFKLVPLPPFNFCATWFAEQLVWRKRQCIGDFQKLKGVGVEIIFEYLAHLGIIRPSQIQPIALAFAGAI